MYTKKAAQKQENFIVTQVGLLIDLEKPFIGATPDGLVKCSCCGEGVLEVKCPLCVKNKLPDEEDEEIKQFCMTKQDEQWSLKREHCYYYQVQTQLHVSKRLYCDFVVWSENDGLIVEWIDKDDAFFHSIVDDVQYFFTYGVLPEIVGKWYTRIPVANSDGIIPIVTDSDKEPMDQDGEDYTKLWCYCSQPSHGLMIQCDNSECTIQWFHCDCLRIRNAPKGKWKCQSCRKLPKKK